MITINIAKDFSRSPGPRYESIGPHSGERFRNEILLPAIRKSEDLKIILDGTLGYGSSFLEEAFGGLVRGGTDRDYIDRIQFVSEEEPELIDEILEYIHEAAFDHAV